jgi:hypothetical protein
MTDWTVRILTCKIFRKKYYKLAHRYKIFLTVANYKKCHFVPSTLLEQDFVTYFWSDGFGKKPSAGSFSLKGLSFAAILDPLRSRGTNSFIVVLHWLLPKIRKAAEVVVHFTTTPNDTLCTCKASVL